MSATAPPHTGPPDAGWQTEWPQEAAGPPPRRKGALAFFSELPALVVMFIVAALLMKTFLIQLFFIPSESMDPTLHGCSVPSECGTGDRVVVNKLAYRLRDPQRGEVAVFIAERRKAERSLKDKISEFFLGGLGITLPDEKDFIKRIIGLPGETIEVTEKAVYITPEGAKKKRKLVEPYAKTEGGTNLSLQEPFTVPRDMYFMMGDNRNNSADSRTDLGPIRRADLIGKAFIRIFPGKIPDQSLVDRFRRLSLLEQGTYPPPLGPAEKASAVLAPLPGLVLAGGSIYRIRGRRSARSGSVRAKR